jgi:hypothetical protein
MLRLATLKLTFQVRHTSALIVLFIVFPASPGFERVIARFSVIFHPHGNTLPFNNCGLGLLILNILLLKSRTHYHDQNVIEMLLTLFNRTASAYSHDSTSSSSIAATSV